MMRRYCHKQAVMFEGHRSREVSPDSIFMKRYTKESVLIQIHLQNTTDLDP